MRVEKSKNHFFCHKKRSPARGTPRALGRCPALHTLHPPRPARPGANRCPDPGTPGGVLLRTEGSPHVYSKKKQNIEHVLLTEGKTCGLFALSPANGNRMHRWSRKTVATLYLTQIANQNPNDGRPKRRPHLCQNRQGAIPNTRPHALTFHISNPITLLVVYCLPY